MLDRSSHLRRDGRQCPVKCLDVRDVASSTARQVAEISRTEIGELSLEFPGKMNVIGFQGPDVHARRRDERHRSVKCPHPANGKICMHQLLQCFRRCTERGLFKQRLSEERLRSMPERMRPAHGVHEDIGVDEDHVAEALRRCDSAMVARCCSQSGSTSGPGRASHRVKKASRSATEQNRSRLDWRSSRSRAATRSQALNDMPSLLAWCAKRTWSSSGITN